MDSEEQLHYMDDTGLGQREEAEVRPRSERGQAEQVKVVYLRRSSGYILYAT